MVSMSGIYRALGESSNAIDLKSKYFASSLCGRRNDERQATDDYDGA